MRKLLLTSCAFPTERVTQAFLDLLEQDPREMTSAIITTAAVQLKEHSRPSVKAKKALETMGFRRVDFIDIEFERSR
ncbi:hypothetical protein [Paenibacillus sp. UNC451MF]|uniref:hypothetical protein n=1 Tax=Paenibacillus sp. UNC451MF TaxID=1449063 RepID=UPI00048D8C69|nr:hypothetical protein [Paenibacillus sp. UNC451MF]